MKLRVLRPRLRRPCKQCSVMFMPLGKHTTLCVSCNSHNRNKREVQSNDRRNGNN